MERMKQKEKGTFCQNKSTTNIFIFAYERKPAPGKKKVENPNLGTEIRGRFSCCYDIAGGAERELGLCCHSCSPHSAPYTHAKRAKNGIHS